MIIRWIIECHVRSPVLILAPGGRPCLSLINLSIGSSATRIITSRLWPCSWVKTAWIFWSECVFVSYHLFRLWFCQQSINQLDHSNFEYFLEHNGHFHLLVVPGYKDIYICMSRGHWDSWVLQCCTDGHFRHIRWYQNSQSRRHRRVFPIRIHLDNFPAHMNRFSYLNMSQLGKRTEHIFTNVFICN